MPWSPQDASKHKKGLTDKQKRKWAKVANSQKARGEDDATAIKSANSVTKGAIDRRLKKKNRSS